MEIGIPYIRTIMNENDPYIVYKVEVKFRNWKNSVEKRYSEFLELHREMKMVRKILHTRLPRFPGKHVWKRFMHTFSADDIEERRVGLEEYLRMLAVTECARSTEYFPGFLEMPLEIREEYIIKKD
ncbi:hypothetical protein SteCoe_15812 [Stentor coeruleus]|uniref:PX domain-containing protein n=1 Tax=Stentor coeruleus TaxID=5963 RepID=A0A1R2C2P5_9CILI|nr:hypothetical protein SteCoe_15812 [Stentor coeruleus]